jgi:hypothetical protein
LKTGRPKKHQEKNDEKKQPSINIETNVTHLISSNGVSDKTIPFLSIVLCKTILCGKKNRISIQQSHSNRSDTAPFQFAARFTSCKDPQTYPQRFQTQNLQLGREINCHCEPIIVPLHILYKRRRSKDKIAIDVLPVQTSFALLTLIARFDYALP